MLLFLYVRGEDWSLREVRVLAFGSPENYVASHEDDSDVSRGDSTKRHLNPASDLAEGSSKDVEFDWFKAVPKKGSHPPQKEQPPKPPSHPKPTPRPAERSTKDVKFDWFKRVPKKDSPPKLPSQPTEDPAMRRRLDEVDARKQRLEQVYRKRRNDNPEEWDAYWKDFCDRASIQQGFWEQLQQQRGAILANLEETVRLYEEQMNIPPSSHEEPQSRIPESWRVHVDRPALDRWLTTLQKHPGAKPLVLPRSLQERLKMFKVPFEEKGAMVSVMLDGYEWQLGIAYGGLFESIWYVMQAAINPQIRMQISGQEIVKSRHPLTLLRSCAQKAVLRYESEQKDAAGMKHFEIAGKEPLGYVEVADLSNDLMRETVNGTKMFPQALALRYNVLVPEGGAVTDLSISGLDPERTLHARIQKLYDMGVRNFYVNIQAHGTPMGFGFGGNRLTPSQVTSLFTTFSDCRFTVNTIACYGGGMNETFARYADFSSAQRGRVTVITQTKGDTVNRSIYYSGNDRASIYQAALARALVRGDSAGRRLTFGEAHLLADQEARERGYTDAGAFRSNPGAFPDQTAEQQRKQPPVSGMPEPEQRVA